LGRGVELDARLTALAVQALIAERDTVRVDVRAAGGATLLPPQPPDLEDIGEIPREPEGDVQAHGYGGEVLQAERLEEPVVQDPLSADLHAPRRGPSLAFR